VRTIPGGVLCIQRGPLPWWHLQGRVCAWLEGRHGPMTPDPEPGDLYIGYASARDPQGNVHFALYWNEPWAQVTPKGVTSGTTKCQFFHCDDRPYLEQALRGYGRVFTWPSGEEITESIREAL
jgi:hypothetical protein